MTGNRDSMIRGILFDIGDTLIAATALHKKALEAAAKSSTWLKDANAFIRAYSQADGLIESKNIPDLNHLYSDRRIVQLAFESLNWDFPEDKAGQFVHLYRRELRKRIRPKPSLHRVLKALKRKRILLGIASNGTTREQNEQLDRLHIKEFFDPIIVSEAAGVRKPDPAILLIAKRQWKIKPGEILVLGDRPDWECLAAARAGMKRGLTTQFVDHSASITPETQPDVVIKRFEDLLDLF